MHSLRKLAIFFLWVGLFNVAFTPEPMAQEEPTQQVPFVFVAGTEADGKKMLSAHVATSSPVEGVTVQFFAQRFFGLLPVGEAETDAHGVAYIPFPQDLLGDSRGNVTIVATVEDSNGRSFGTGRAVVGWGLPTPAQHEPFPRALWAPRAPWSLIGVICVVFGGISLTYGYVVVQLVRIARGGGRQ